MENCIYCGSTGPYEKEEHIVCTSLGGTLKLSSHLVCSNCNGSIFPLIEKKFQQSCVAINNTSCNNPAERVRLGLCKVTDFDPVERIIARMTFNFLALVTERQYLYHPAFDQIKDLILNGVKESRVSMYTDDQAVWYKNYVTDAGFPEKGHYISINSWEDKLFGSVGLFGGNHIFNIKIADVVPFPSIKDSMFLCDWINKKDYTLTEFLQNNNRESLKIID
jgi:hypothetical protein